jgi:hypothetical protein
VRFHRIFVHTCKQSNIICSCCVWQALVARNYHPFFIFLFSYLLLCKQQLICVDHIIIEFSLSQGSLQCENPRWVRFHRIFVHTCKQSNIICSCCVWQALVARNYHPFFIFLFSYLLLCKQLLICVDPIIIEFSNMTAYISLKWAQLFRKAYFLQWNKNNSYLWIGNYREL